MNNKQQQLTIPHARWDELINKVSTELWISGVPVEEINIVVSVLKGNTPFNVVTENTPFEVLTENTPFNVVDINTQNIVSNVENNDLSDNKMDLSFIEYCDLNN